jgi:hypothetical protein
MTPSTRIASWTGLLAGAVAHDINNFVQGVSSARALAGAPGATMAGGAETEAIIEDDLDQLRLLGGRLRALASAGIPEVATPVADACADAVAEVDPSLEQVRAESIPADLRVGGTPAALTAAIACLLEHALIASPAGATVNLTVRGWQSAGPLAGERPTPVSPGMAVAVEIAAPRAGDLGDISRARLDVVLARDLPELRGDARLIVGGAIADALGGAVYITSDAQAGLVLALHLVAC